MDPQTLHRRAQDGGAEAYRLLVTPHLGRVARQILYRLASGEDREDALQQTLLLGWRG